MLSVLLLIALHILCGYFSGAQPYDNHDQFKNSSVDEGDCANDSFYYHGGCVDCHCPLNDSCSLNGMCSSGKCAEKWIGPGCQKRLPELKFPPHVQISEGRVNLTWWQWNPHYVGNMDVGGYLVEYRTNSTNWTTYKYMQHVVNRDIRTIIIADLLSNEKYQFRVSVIGVLYGKAQSPIMGKKTGFYNITSHCAGNHVEIVDAVVVSHVATSKQVFLRWKMLQKMPNCRLKGITVLAKLLPDNGTYLLEKKLLAKARRVNVDSLPWNKKLNVTFILNFENNKISEFYYDLNINRSGEVKLTRNSYPLAALEKPKTNQPKKLEKSIEYYILRILIPIAAALLLLFLLALFWLRKSRQTSTSAPINAAQPFGSSKPVISPPRSPHSFRHSEYAKTGLQHADKEKKKFGLKESPLDHDLTPYEPGDGPNELRIELAPDLVYYIRSFDERVLTRAWRLRAQNVILLEDVPVKRMLGEPMRVECVSEREFHHHSVSLLRMTSAHHLASPNTSPKSRGLVHFVNVRRFTAWHSSLPISAESFVEFAQVILREGLPQKLLVHDSPGAGLFVALCHLLCELKHQNWSDVKSCVARIRLARHELLTTMEQYQFLKECINVASRRNIIAS